MSDEKDSIGSVSKSAEQNPLLKRILNDLKEIQSNAQYLWAGWCRHNEWPPCLAEYIEQILDWSIAARTALEESRNEVSTSVAGDELAPSKSSAERNKQAPAASTATTDNDKTHQQRLLKVAAMDGYVAGYESAIEALKAGLVGVKETLAKEMEAKNGV